MEIQEHTKKELFAALDTASAELLSLISNLTEHQINIIPFKDSWTAAQLATHVTKSNQGVSQAMDMEGKLPDRKPTERVEDLKKMFLDFDHKMKSPEFIVPPAGNYGKEDVIASLKKSIESLKQKRELVYLYELVELSALGKITKLELFYFVLYHTQRHIHQLKKIITHI